MISHPSAWAVGRFTASAERPGEAAWRAGAAAPPPFVPVPASSRFTSKALGRFREGMGAAALAAFGPFAPTATVKVHLLHLIDGVPSCTHIFEMPPRSPGQSSQSLSARELSRPRVALARPRDCGAIHVFDTHRRARFLKEALPLLLLLVANRRVGPTLR